MSSITGFWKRVGGLWDNIVRGNGGGWPALRAPPTADTPADSGANSAHPPVPQGESPSTRSELSAAQRPGGWLLRSSTQQRLLELMDAMQAHFQQQDARARGLAAAVERVACTLERLGDSQRAQGECLVAIAGQVSGASAQVAALAAFLRELPGSVHEQAEALRLLARQMESAHQIDVQMVRSLEQFSSAVDSLRESGAAAVRTIERLHEAEREQTQSLRSFIREQSQSFLLATMVAIGLGIAALVGLLLLLVRSG